MISIRFINSFFTFQRSLRIYPEISLYDIDQLSDPALDLMRIASGSLESIHDSDEIHENHSSIAIPGCTESRRMLSLTIFYEKGFLVFFVLDIVVRIREIENVFSRFHKSSMNVIRQDSALPCALERMFQLIPGRILRVCSDDALNPGITEFNLAVVFVGIEIDIH